MHLSAAVDNGLAHGTDDAGKTVGAYVRMGVYKYVMRGAVLMQHVENLVHRATFFAAGVELAVRESAGTSLAEAIIGIRVNDVAAGNGGQVAAS